MTKNTLIALFGLCLAVALLPPHQSRAQKFMIPKMTASGGNVLQVEGVNGQPVKINYNYNTHRKEMQRNGDPYFQSVHDEILYSATEKIITINYEAYLLSSADMQMKKIARKSKTFSINSLPENSAARNALNSFIQIVARNSGIAGKTQRSIAVTQIDGKLVAEQVKQLETLLPR